MSTLLLIGISLLTALVTLGAIIVVSVAAEGIEKAIRWAQRIGKSECQWCHCPIPKGEAYCERHRHLGDVRYSRTSAGRPLTRHA